MAGQEDEDVRPAFGAARSVAVAPKVDTSKLTPAPEGVGGCFIVVEGKRYWHPDFPVPGPVDSHGYPSYEGPSEDEG